MTITLSIVAATTAMGMTPGNTSMRMLPVASGTQTSTRVAFTTLPGLMVTTALLVVTVRAGIADTRTMMKQVLTATMLMTRIL